MVEDDGRPHARARIIAFAQRQVTLTDIVFTAGGVALILFGGVGNAVLQHMDVWHTRWLAWGMALFIGSGIIWMVAKPA